MKLAICSIVKNELNLDAFITYHKYIGFDHIFIFEDYDNKIPVDTHRFTEKQGVFFSKLAEITPNNINRKQIVKDQFSATVGKEYDYIIFVYSYDFINYKSVYYNIKEAIECNKNSTIKLSLKMFGPKTDQNTNYKNPIYKYCHRLPELDNFDENSFYNCNNLTPCNTEDDFNTNIWINSYLCQSLQNYLIKYLSDNLSKPESWIYNRMLFDADVLDVELSTHCMQNKIFDKTLM